MHLVINASEITTDTEQKKKQKSKKITGKQDTKPDTRLTLEIPELKYRPNLT